MLALLGTVIATSPFGVVFGLLAWAGHRERRRRDLTARQIALTDGIHERLGAVAAPVVRRGRHCWQVRIDAPFERPAVIRALLAVVHEAFVERDGDRRSVEIILTRQPDIRRAPGVAGRDVERRSLSWT